jgi:KAP-like P-loop domain-containing protein
VSQDVEASDSLPELSVDRMRERIRLRLERPEFAQAPVTPQVDPAEAAAAVSIRLRDVIEDVAQTRTALAAAERAFSARWPAVRFTAWAVFVVACIVSLGLAVGLSDRGDTETHIWFVRLDFDPKNWGAYAFVAVVAAMTALGVRSWYPTESPRGRQRVELTRTARSASADLDTRLDFEVDRLLRLDADAIGARQGTFAVTPEAPDLVEVEAAQAAETPNIRRLRELISHSSTSAFAIAGPRGMGKSTLISALTSDRELFGAAAVVPAPVRYDPDALLRRIFAELAKAILRREGADNVLVELRRQTEQRMRLRRLRVVMLLLVVGTVLIAVDLFSRAVATSWLGTAGLFGVALILGAFMAFGDAAPPGRWPVGRLRNAVVDNAVDALQGLRFATEATETQKLSLNSAKALVGLEDSDAITRKERESSRPQLVGDLTDFLRRHLLLARRASDAAEVRVAVAVDELDKMASTDEMIETINSLKDLFRIPGVHFLVSVSNDAVNRFSLRGVAARDAFDSSFDAVIELDRLSAEQSHEILSSRALGYPRQLSSVVHAWSGGLPRDLIRLARRSVELRRTEDVTSIDQLAARLVGEDVRLVLMALRDIEFDTDQQAGWHKATASGLTPTIERLSPSALVGVTSNDLAHLMDAEAQRCGELEASVQSTAVRLFGSAAITLSFASTLARSADGNFAQANLVAELNVRRSEPLGEFLRAATQVRAQLSAGPDVERWAEPWRRVA